MDDPHPTRKYPDQKVWVWVPFSSLKTSSFMGTGGCHSATGPFPMFSAIARAPGHSPYDPPGRFKHKGRQRRPRKEPHNPQPSWTRSHCALPIYSVLQYCICSHERGCDLHVLHLLQNNATRNGSSELLFLCCKGSMTRNTIAYTRVVHLYFTQRIVFLCWFTFAGVLFRSHSLKRVDAAL